MVTLKAQLVEKQAVQSENDRLKLQLDSVQAQNQMEQRKAGEERSEATPHTHTRIYTETLTLTPIYLFPSSDELLFGHTHTH